MKGLFLSLWAAGIIASLAPTGSNTKPKLFEGTRLSKDIELNQEQKSQAITNAGFPGCCHGNETFHVTCVPVDTCFIHVEFTDLDIPPGGQVKIYRGSILHNAVGVTDDLTPRPNGYFRREITIVFEVANNSIGTDTDMSTGTSGTGNETGTGWHTGFRILLQLATYEGDIYGTACLKSPTPDELWAGETILTFGHNRPVDCMWQLKLPRINHKGLKIHLNVSTVRLVSGFLQITEGWTSLDPQVTRYDSIVIAPNISVQNITTDKGLYIRVKMRSASVWFTATYFTEPAPSDRRQYVCTMEYGGQSVTGIRCRQPDRCVSNRTACNTVTSCGNDQDELDPFCGPPPTQPSTLPPTTTHSPYITTTDPCSGQWLKKCTNGKCLSSWDFCPEECVHQQLYKLCSDGRCIMDIYDCGCPSKQRRCSDGSCFPLEVACRKPRLCPSGRECPDRSCADRHKHCAGEPCPTGTLGCGGRTECYWASAACDGVQDCYNNYDEGKSLCYWSATTWVPPRTGSRNTVWVPVVVVLLIVVIVVGVICYLRYRRAKSEPTELPPTYPDSNRPRQAGITLRPDEIRLFPLNDQGSDVSDHSPRPHSRNHQQYDRTEGGVIRVQPSVPPGGVVMTPAELLPPPAYEDVTAHRTVFPPTANHSNDKELPPYEAVSHIHTDQTAAPVQGESSI